MFILRNGGMCVSINSCACVAFYVIKYLVHTSVSCCQQLLIFGGYDLKHTWVLASMGHSFGLRTCGILAGTAAALLPLACVTVGGMGAVAFVRTGSSSSFSSISSYTCINVCAATKIPEKKGENEEL